MSETHTWVIHASPPTPENYVFIRVVARMCCKTIGIAEVEENTVNSSVLSQGDSYLWGRERTYWEWMRAMSPPMKCYDVRGCPWIWRRETLCVPHFADPLSCLIMFQLFVCRPYLCVTSGVSCEKSWNNCVTPHLHREHLWALQPPRGGGRCSGQITTELKMRASTQDAQY